MIRILGFMLSLAVFISACQDPVFTPKPRAYPRVDYPAKSYQDFTEGYCDFTFEFPAYATVEQDSFFFGERPAHPCWFDLYFPDFDSRLHCSYTPITAGKTFDDLRSDAFGMANYHNQKANYIDELLIQNNLGAAGIAFAFEGPVASPYQFFLTDSSQQHFFRAALYFNTQAKPDSLAPIVEFLVEDFDRMVSTFQWQ
jgi:gliding motility-associated lipoprotein GldD